EGEFRFQVGTLQLKHADLDWLGDCCSAMCAYDLSFWARGPQGDFVGALRLSASPAFLSYRVRSVAE
ncbi:hypothetical protein Dimus_011033, partial [Dionaea muscipula]